MHDEIDGSHEPRHVGAESREQYLVADRERVSLRTERFGERPAPEADETRPRKGRSDVGERAQQIRVSLALDELRDDTDDD